MAPNTIYLTRHGQSEYNVSQRLGGDSDITDHGRKYAYELSKYFDNRSIEVDVYTSSLRRTIQTAQYFKKNSRVMELDELNAGVYDGYTYKEIETKYPEEYHKRTLDKYNYCYPGGESYRDINERVKEFIHTIIGSRGNTLIICHQAVLRVLYSYLIDVDKPDVPHLDIPLNTLFKFDIYENGKTDVKRIHFSI